MTPTGRVGSILWRPEIARYQKGSGHSATRVRKAERGSARRESLEQQLPIAQLFPARASARSDGWLQGSCSRKRAGLPLGSRRGVVVLCPLRSRFTKDHRGVRVSRKSAPHDPLSRGKQSTSPATAPFRASSHLPAPFSVPRPIDGGIQAERAPPPRSRASA